MSEDSELTKKLVSLKPQHDFFVGIDSDGCVYDAMWKLNRKNVFARIQPSMGVAANFKYAEKP